MGHPKYIVTKGEILLNGKNILDLGSGPGNDAKYFKDKGFMLTAAVNYSF